MHLTRETPIETHRRDFTLRNALSKSELHDWNTRKVAVDNPRRVQTARLPAQGSAELYVRLLEKVGRLRVVLLTQGLLGLSAGFELIPAKGQRFWQTSHQIVPR